MSADPAQDFLGGLRDLPVLPAVVLELIESLAQAQVTIGELAQKIAHDQALAAKTLRLANSTFYGMPRQVSAISEAATILGLRTLRSVATAAGLVGGLAPGACAGFDFQSFWRHGIGTALCARLIARGRAMDEEAAFTLGLLHDIGRLALVTRYPQAYAQVLARQRATDEATLDAERGVLGLDHAAAGAVMARHWRFAPEVAQAIALHHNPPLEGQLSLIDVVHVADCMAHALDLAQLQHDAVPSLSLVAWHRLALEQTECLELFAEVERQHEAVCQALLT